MIKNKKYLIEKITDKHLKIAIGTCICLISIFCVLNFGYVSSFIFWLVSFFVGSLFAYVFYVLLFLYGLKFIFQKKFTIRNFNLLLIGCVIISFGVLIITTNQIPYFTDGYLTFSNFREAFISSLNLEQFPFLQIDKSGGIVGMTLVAILNSAFTPLGTTIFSGILIAAGTILVLARPVIYLVHTFYADKKDISANEAAITEYEEESALLESNLNLSRDGNIDYTIDDDKLNDEKSNNLKEVGFENDKTSDSVEEFDINEEIEPQVQETKSLDELEESKLLTNYNNNEDVDDFFVGGLQRVKFNPDSSFENASNSAIEDFSIEKEMTPLESFKLDDTKQIKSDDNNFEESNDIHDFKNDFEEKNDDSFEPTSDLPYEEKQISFEESQSISIEPLKAEKENLVIEKPSLDPNEQIQEQIREREIASREIHPIIEEPIKPAPILKSTVVEEESTGPFKKLPKNHIKYQQTPIDLLDESKSNEEIENKNIAICEERKERINELLKDFKIGAKITSYKIGPSVTRYDLETERNVSILGIDKYMNDISLRLGGLEARFVPIIQGKTTSGIEIANENRAMVAFRDVFEHLPRPKPGKLEVPFGVNISGDYISADLANFPHMLVCGTTGSGKSIYMHSVILSLIMRNSMDEVKLIMVDPKCVEFKKYEEIPHLLCPIITEPAEASATLFKLVDEMEDRFRLFSDAGVSDIKQYNEICAEKHYQKLPYIVLIIDEFADLIESNKTVAQPVSRLGAKARAAGIHMIIATQRPSTDVITGTIKSNLAVRVALMTSSPTDSVVVLGEGGAEKLLGNGDMLVNCALVSKQEKTRVQGCFVSNGEIIRVVNYIKQNYPLNYDERFVGLLEKSRLEATDLGVIHNDSGVDNAYEMVKEHVMKERDTCSISYISNTFHFGFKRSSEIFNRMLAEHIIEKPEYSNSAKGAKVMVHLAGYKDPNAEPEAPGSYSQSTFKAN